MSDWISTRNRKKQQRKMNKIVREMNKHIEQDDLWKGRFCCRQILSPVWYTWDDNSGSVLFVQLLFIDKKTGKTFHYADDVASWYHFNHWRLWEKMNWFITEYCQVWREDPRPDKKTAIDYTKVDIDIDIEKLKENR